MLSFQIPIVIGGAVMAYVLFRRLASGRVVDPRDEIRTELESLRRVTAALPEQMNVAKRSMATAEAKGLLGSETTRLWLGAFEADLAEAELVASEVPSTDESADDRSVMRLELRLAEILVLSIRANRLADKYSRPLSADAADAADAADSDRLPHPAGALVQPVPALQSGMSLIAPS
jgi:hypothetical protein